MAEDGKPDSVRPVDVDLDFENRDPRNLNNHVQATFEDVIGEPEGAHSVECVWRNAFKCYHTGSNCCYTFLTYVCAIPLAFCWGCQFSCLTFCHIWTVTPCFRYFNLNLQCAAKFFSTVVHCCCDPCYESVAIIFTKIYVHTVGDSNDYKRVALEEV